MKHLLIFLVLFLVCALGFSQSVPQRINYQGMARTSAGVPLTNHTIGVQFRILQGLSGPQVFTEAHTLVTSPLGLFNTQIGSVNNNLGSVDWANGPYFLEVSIDTNSVSGYILLGTQQLVTVPYAMYAQSAASAPAPTVGISSSNVLSVGGNTVNLPAASAQSLSLSGNTLSITGGTPVTLPTTTVTGTGAISVNTITGGFNVNTPSVTVGPIPLIGSGLLTFAGSYPNFQITAIPAITYNPGNGDIVFSNSLTPSVPGITANITPTLAVTSGSILTVGPPTNTIALPSSGGTFVATPNTSLVATGALSSNTLATNLFSLNVPATSINAGSGISVGGSFPNYTVSALGVLPTTVTGSGAASVSSPGTNTFDVFVPSVSLTPGTNVTLNGTFPNYTINATAPPVTLTQSTNITVNGSYPNYTLSANVPPVTLTQSTNITVNGSYPNYTLSANVPPVTLTQSTNITVNGSYPNYTLSATNPGVSMSATGAASVTPASGTSFTVNVPATSVISSNSTATVSATGTNSFDISVPAQLNLSATGGSTKSGAYPNITINSPQQLTLTTAGATTLGGTYPNLNVGTPVLTVSPIAGTFNGGLLSILGSYPNYSLAAAPTISYSSGTGSLVLTNPTTLNSFSYNITPSVSISNNVLQSGPSTNTVAIVSPAAQAFAVSGNVLAVTSGGAAIFSTSFTKQVASSEVDVFAHVQASTGIIAVLGNLITFEITLDGNTSVVSIPHSLTPNDQNYVTLKAVFSGISAGSHTIAIRAKTNGGVATFVTLDPNSYGGKLILKETY